MSTRQYVVTGTDTGVGKTWVACALAAELAALGRRVVAVKPVETGHAGAPSDAEDGVMLARAARQAAPLHALRRFAAPVAPPLAAERAGEALDYDALVTEIAAASEGAEVVIVEGAGGALSPLTWERTIADLAVDLGARAVVVAVDRLGTIHHTRAAIAALEGHGVEIAAIVLCAPEAPDDSTGSNASALARFASARIVEVPRDGAGALADLAASL